MSAETELKEALDERRDGMKRVAEDIRQILQMQYSQTESLVKVSKDLDQLRGEVEGFKTEMAPVIGAWKTGEGIYGFVKGAAKFASAIAMLAGVWYWIIHGANPPISKD
jgi:hypothetical protein